MTKEETYKLLDLMNKDDAHVVGISKVTLLSLANSTYGTFILDRVRKRVKQMNKLEKEINNVRKD